MTENREYHVLTCHECACGISNGDWSDNDMLDPDEADEQMASIEASLESLGVLSHKETKDYGGYWNCEVCGSVNIGRGHVYVQEDYFYQDEVSA